MTRSISKRAFAATIGLAAVLASVSSVAPAKTAPKAKKVTKPATSVVRQATTTTAPAAAAAPPVTRIDPLFGAGAVLGRVMSTPDEFGFGASFTAAFDSKKTPSGLAAAAANEPACAGMEKFLQLPAVDADSAQRVEFSTTQGFVSEEVVVMPNADAARRVMAFYRDTDAFGKCNALASATWLTATGQGVVTVAKSWVRVPPTDEYGPDQVAWDITYDLTVGPNTFSVIARVVRTRVGRVVTFFGGSTGYAGVARAMAERARTLVAA